HDSKVVAPAKVYSVRDILGIRGRSGGSLYAADAIEYIVGGTGTNGQLTARLDVRNLRRIAEATGRGVGRPGSDAYGLRQAAGPNRPIPIDELLPPVNPNAGR
ncbi:MAG: Flp pilus assembly protein CpaB, partial [Acidithiobacillus sp.]